MAKIMNPAFHRSRPIKTFGSVMPFLFSAIDENPDKVMISKQIKGFTLDALGLSVFGELYSLSVGSVPRVLMVGFTQALTFSR